MYTLVSAIGETLGGDSRWKDVSIGEVLMPTIYSTYSGVIAVLSNSFLDHNVALDLSLIRAAHGTKELTFNQLLASLGNEALPTTDTLPQLKTRYARYNDAVRAGYKVTPVHPSWAVDAEMPPSERTWLLLQKPGVNYQQFLEHCMVSVNGLWHQIDADDTGAYVKEGNKSRTLSGHNHIGVFSFLHVGKLKYVPITPQMVYKQRPEQSLRHTAYINVGESIADKTVILVLGGYMHVMDNSSFFRTSDQSIGINLENLPLFERYHESMGLIDWSAIPIERTVRNPTQVGVVNFLGDEVLTAWLTMSQSFIVLLDNPNVFVSRLPVHTTRLPGQFTSFIKPEYPLITGYGLMPNYWSTYEDRQWGINCVGGLRDQPLHQTVDQLAQVGISDSRIPDRRRRLSGAHFLQLGRDI